MNLPCVMLFSQNHQLSAYAAIQAVIPGHNPWMLVIQILFQQGQMVEYQPEPTDQLINTTVL